MEHRKGKIKAKERKFSNSLKHSLHLKLTNLKVSCFIREKKYEIDGSNLEGKYKDWQKKLHPDLVHTKSEVCFDTVTSQVKNSSNFTF